MGAETSCATAGAVSAAPGHSCLPLQAYVQLSVRCFLGWEGGKPSLSWALGVRVDEVEDAAPRVVGVSREVLVAAVEERVRGAFVRDDFVLDAGRGQRLVERGVELGRDVLVVARLEREDRRRDLVHAARRADP